MRWPPVRERWLYRDPCEVGDALVRWCAKQAAREGPRVPVPVDHPVRDRYYTQARRIHVKQLMRGKG